MESLNKIKLGDTISNWAENINDNFTDIKNAIDITETKLGTIEEGAEANTVYSVNGKTGAVSLVAGDVDAYTKTETRSYIEENGGKIDEIQKNGQIIDIVNKTVNIPVPEALTDLTNDGNFVQDANYVHTDNNYTSAEKEKLSGIESGAEVNVQADWSRTNINSDDFIKNKPTELSQFNEDSTHRLVTDVEKSTWNGKQSALTFDNTPTENSTNPVTSGGVYTTTNQLSSDVDAIEEKIPTQASSTNQLADKDFVNSSINAFAAFYITKNSAGEPFATKSELNNTIIFYSGGNIRIPTTNDYCIVLSDESKTDMITGVNPTTRYSYQNNQWEFQYIVNNTALTAAQFAALNSGITSEKVSQIDTNKSNISSLSSNKQDVISDLATIRSNASAGASASSTISGYGDVVTHNASEFATSAQGEKADTAIQPSDLANVATSGNYSDLLNKPTIPATASDVGALSNSTKYGAGLSVSGRSLQLLDQDGNNLGSPITTQDTDTGATSVGLKTGDTGNVVTAMTYDSSTRKITYEMGITALTSHQDISGKEDISNKVTSLSQSSTDEQYPSAKCVYDLVGDINTILTQLNSGIGV